MAKNDQADRRRYQKYKDQHGRDWGANIEVSNGQPTGKIEALHTAPLAVPQKFIRTVEGKPYDLHIDYRTWEEELRTADREYRRLAMEEGMRQQGDAYDAEAPIKPGVLSVIGGAPQSILPVIAARQENAYVLGFDPRPDRRLAHFFIREKVSDEVDFSSVDYGEPEEKPKEKPKEKPEDKKAPRGQEAPPTPTGAP
jgi:hypothetical protein